MKFQVKVVFSMAIWLCIVLLIYYLPDLPTYNEPILTGIAIGGFLAGISLFFVFDDD